MFSDWAVQNAKLEAAQFLVSNYDLDVLAKNAMGRSVLTDAFQAGNTDLIELCLSHPTSSEERLIAVDGAKVKAKPDGSVSISTDGGDGATEEGADGPSSSSPPVQSSVKDLEANAVTHRLAFREADLQDAAAHLVVRELPIDHADSPFGTDTAPELDTTGRASRELQYCTQPFNVSVYCVHVLSTRSGHLARVAAAGPVGAGPRPAPRGPRRRRAGLRLRCAGTRSRCV